MIDLRFTDLPLYSRLMSEVNFEAACTSKVAGRAWIPVSATMWNSLDAILKCLLIYDWNKFWAFANARKPLQRKYYHNDC
jgi:hypothetical protein